MTLLWGLVVFVGSILFIGALVIFIGHVTGAPDKNAKKEESIKAVVQF